MLYNIFNTEAEAIEAQAYDFSEYISHFTDPRYISETVCWDVPRQRLTDSKWVYRVCPLSDGQYVTEQFSIGWFPPAEE